MGSSIARYIQMRGPHEFDIERCLQEYDDDLRCCDDEGDEPRFDDVPFWHLPSQQSCATRQRVSSRLRFVSSMVGASETTAGAARAPEA